MSGISSRVRSRIKDLSVTINEGRCVLQPSSRLVHLEAFPRVPISRKLSNSVEPVMKKIEVIGLVWACQHRHWTVDDWKHVACSNESGFQFNRTDARVRLWRPLYESLDPTCQQRTVQAVMQDNATPHTSTIATKWLQKHSSELRHFRWPPKSSAMNISEYPWDDLQRALQKRSPYPITPADL
ncbi:transposable element Tcb2 transposase [Trichonephila clavipes]|nr:transposable element Tcb2 transposase [Trichonephila clavipes]